MARAFFKITTKSNAWSDDTETYNADKMEIVGNMVCFWVGGNEYQTAINNIVSIVPTSC